MLCRGRNLAKPLPVGMWKTENIHNEWIGPAKEIFRQNFRSANWLFLTTYDKVMDRKRCVREGKKGRGEGPCSF